MGKAIPGAVLIGRPRRFPALALAAAIAPIALTGGALGLSQSASTARPAVSASEAVRQCSASVYRGFDSRLSTTLVARIPASKEHATGFTLFRGKPVIAFAHRILTVSDDGSFSALPSFKPIGKLLAGPDELRAESTGGLLRYGEKGLEPVAQAGYAAKAMLAQSATPRTAMGVQNGGNAEISVLAGAGPAIPLFRVAGQLRQLSWTSAGLAAIVDETLLTFASGESNLYTTPPDAAFRQAEDLCMVGPSRAVVMFPGMAVLYAHGRRTILGAASHGRCAWDGVDLYIFDSGKGSLWKIGNLDKVGEPESTKQFLQELAAKARTQDDAGKRAYGELVRFVGFEKASALTGVSNPCPAAIPPAPPAPARAAKASSGL